MHAIVLPRFRAHSCAAVLVFVLLIPAVASAGLPRRFPEQCQITPGTPGTEIFLAGDVNGDGKVDILSGTRNPASYLLSLGNGDGTFSPQIPVTLDSGIYSIVLADVDGDGRADAVVTNYSKDSVTEYPGLASGGFGPGRLLVSYSRPAGLAVADLNSDGRADLVITTYLDSKLRTYFQAPDGTFTPVSVVPSLSSPSVLRLADMNGDGQPDAVLLTGDAFPRVRIYLGSADGTFSPFTGVDANGTGLSIGDFNGDGIKDLAVWGFQNDALIVFLGTGGGALGPGTHLLGYSFIRGAAVGDWTGDGIDDLILSKDQGSTANSALYLFPGSANGISGTNQLVPAPITSSNTLSADFNGDGQMDVAGASTIGISVTAGRPNGGFFGSVYEIALPGNAQDIALGDVLGNGHADLALQIAAPPGTVYRVYRSFADQSLQQSAEVSRSNSGAGILLDDMNGDGRADLLALTGGPGTLSTYLSGPNGSLAAPSDLALSGPSPSAFGVGHIGLDSKSPDVVYVQPNYNFSNNGFIGGLVNEGDGTFQSGYLTMSPEGPKKMALDHIDLTHPYLDALTISAAGDLVLFRGTGNTRFEWPAPLGYPGDRAGIVLGDLDGDGHVDALTWPASGNSISIFWGAGDGTFAAPVSRPTVAGISGLAVGDVDGNSTLDIVVTHGNRNSVGILYGKGDGSFSAEDEYLVDPNTALPRVGDIDGDGRADIVLASSSNALVDVLFQRASAVAVEPSPPKSFGLQLASANPARGSMTFRLSLPGPGSARLGIFDLRGRLVREYTDLRRVESVRWDGRFATGERAAAGVYFARLRLDRSEATAKFVWMN